MKHLIPSRTSLVAALAMLLAASPALPQATASSPTASSPTASSPTASSPAAPPPAIASDVSPEMQRALDTCGEIMDKADLGVVWAKMPGPEGATVMDPPPAMRDDPSFASEPEQAAIGRLLAAREQCDRIVHPAMPSVPDFLKRLTATENALLLRLQQGKMSWGEFNRTRGAAWAHAARAAERQP